MTATKNIDQEVPLFTEALAEVSDALPSKETTQPEPSDVDVPLLTSSTDIPLTLTRQDVDCEPNSATVAQAESAQSKQVESKESTESQTQTDETNILILATGQTEGVARISGTARASAFSDIVFTEQQTRPKQPRNRKKPVQTDLYRASGEKTWLWIILGVCALIALGWGYRKITNPTASDTDIVFRPILIPAKPKVAVPPASTLRHDATQQVSPFAHFPNESSPTGVDQNANPNSASANNATNATNGDTNASTNTSADAQATSEATATNPATALVVLPPNTSIIEQNLRLINSIENYHKQLPKPEPVPANLLRK